MPAAKKSRTRKATRKTVAPRKRTKVRKAINKAVVVTDVSGESHGLGHVPTIDDGDFKYPMSPHVGEIDGDPMTKTQVYALGPIMDQGETQSCVGHGWTLFITSAPRPTSPGPDPYRIYHRAQKLDDTPGAEPLYYGTSVRADLVSNAFEKRFRIPVLQPDGEPILGMEKFIRKDKALCNLITSTGCWVLAPNTAPAAKDQCAARHHGDFDNDAATLQATLARILGQKSDAFSDFTHFNATRRHVSGCRRAASEMGGLNSSNGKRSNQQRNSANYSYNRFGSAFRSCIEAICAPIASEMSNWRN